MFMAIAVESSKHPRQKDNYKVWYLEINDLGDVVGIGVKSKEELIQGLFKSYRQTGKSNWRAFPKDSDESRSIEVFDFISQEKFENTHFGNLPTLGEFQHTLDSLQMNLELRSIA